jgi:hypothetical protein
MADHDDRAPRWIGDAAEVIGENLGTEVALAEAAGDADRLPPAGRGRELTDEVQRERETGVRRSEERRKNYEPSCAARSERSERGVDVFARSLVGHEHERGVALGVETRERVPHLLVAEEATIGRDHEEADLGPHSTVGV